MIGPIQIILGVNQIEQQFIQFLLIKTYLKVILIILFMQMWIKEFLARRILVYDLIGQHIQNHGEKGLDVSATGKYLISYLSIYHLDLLLNNTSSFEYDTSDQIENQFEASNQQVRFKKAMIVAYL